MSKSRFFLLHQVQPSPLDNICHDALIHQVHVKRTAILMTEASTLVSPATQVAPDTVQVLNRATTD